MKKPILTATCLVLALSAGDSLAFGPIAIGSDFVVINEDMSATASAFTESVFDNSEDNFFTQVSHWPTDGNPDDRIEIIHIYDPVQEPTISPDDYDSISFHDYNLFTWDPATDGDIIDVSFSLDVENNADEVELFFTVSSGISTRGDGFQFVSNTDGYVTFTAENLTFDHADLNNNGPVTFGFAIQTRVQDFRDDDASPYEGDQFAVNVDNFVVTVTAIPEPSSLALLGLGGLCLIRTRTRTRS